MTSTTNRKKPVPHVPDALLSGGSAGFRLAVERTQRELAIRARSGLVTAAAHDLRSPLNGIQGWAHVLESRIGSESPLVRRALAGIQNGVEQQAQLIGDLTDMLHIMNASMSLHPEVVSLHGVLQGVLNGMQEATASRRIEFMLNGDDVAVWADPGRLTQAMERVLSHVLRMEGEKIVVEASATASDASIRIDGQSGLISPAKEGGPRRVIKIPASMLLAHRLIELNHGRMQGLALDGEGTREAFIITLMKADARAAWHENDSQGDLMHRRLVAARAHVSLDPLRIALVRGEGGDALAPVLQGLGAHVDVFDEANAEDVGDDHDLVMLPCTAEAATATPCLGYGQDPATAQHASGTVGSIPAGVEPLQLAAAVMVATRFDPASQPSF
jgi:hypothetical protein